MLEPHLIEPIARLVGGAGDLAHFVLFLWASSTTSLLVWSLREMARANRRFDDFVAAIARLNRLFAAFDDD